MTALATLIFTTALCFTLWTGFVTLNLRWDVILALLAGRPDPRFGAPFGTGFRPSDRAAARLAGSRFNPSRGEIA